MSGFSQLITELRRRKVFRVAVTYGVVGWLAIEIASVVLPTFDSPEWVMKVFTFLVILGFPIALTLAWAFEVTPQGIKREKDIDRGEPDTARPGRKLDMAVIAVLAIAVGVLWYKLDQRGSDSADLSRVPAPEETVRAANGAPANSIAVLPFTNMSPDPDNEYFSEGITEEITSKLARIEDLAVASRTSVLRFKSTELDIREIAATLGVRYVLEGSVRKAGEQVRISAQLIDSETGFHTWSEDFDGQLDDIFDVQERTAVKIAEALDLRLTPQEQQALRRRYIDNSEAYVAFLRGQALVQYFDDLDKLNAARAHFEKAIELEPDYPPALAGLASVQAQIYRNVEADEKYLQRGIELANRALELDPRLVRGHIAAGELLGMQYDYAGASRKFREVLEMEPDNPWAWDLLSWTLGYEQPPKAAEAEAAAREAIRLQPQFAYAHYHLGRALLLQDRPKEAVAAFQHILELDPGAVVAFLGLAQAYLALGDYRQARESVNRSLENGETPIVLVYQGYVLAAQGDREGALKSLGKALELDYTDFAALDASPYLAELRSDPRYKALIEGFRTQGP